MSCLVVLVLSGGGGRDRSWHRANGGTSVLSTRPVNVYIRKHSTTTTTTVPVCAYVFTLRPGGPVFFSCSRDARTYVNLICFISLPCLAITTIFPMCLPRSCQVDTARAAQRFDLSGYGGIGAMEVRNRETLTAGLTSWCAARQAGECCTPGVGCLRLVLVSVTGRSAPLLSCANRASVHTLVFFLWCENAVLSVSAA